MTKPWEECSTKGIFCAHPGVPFQSLLGDHFPADWTLGHFDVWVRSSRRRRGRNFLFTSRRAGLGATATTEMANKNWNTPKSQITDGYAATVFPLIQNKIAASGGSAITVVDCIFLTPPSQVWNVPSNSSFFTSFSRESSLIFWWVTKMDLT